MSTIPTTNTRIDKPADVVYPTIADARGSSRINYGRKQYYLGPFGSPQSYVMFGLWKQSLLETGHPIDTKELRPLADSVLQQSKLVTVRSLPRLQPSLLVTVLSLCCAILIGALIISINQSASVDRKVLTHSEAEVIRGIRMHQTSLLGFANERNIRIAQVLSTRSFKEQLNDSGENTQVVSNP